MPTLVILHTTAEALEQAPMIFWLFLFWYEVISPEYDVYYAL